VVGLCRAIEHGIGSGSPEPRLSAAVADGGIMVRRISAAVRSNSVGSFVRADPLAAVGDDYR